MSPSKPISHSSNKIVIPHLKHIVILNEVRNLLSPVPTSEL
jgi:hypothetical protein